ncbi:Adenosylmethionine-8-amino-7-oxononanoate aminotransferase [Rickettsiales bacterium Ac37b]|nr:Adenosylmethionine-8-amino-7-oxononanoate aminotransferase [Rickettsiales bacterium Ac37b]
MQKSQWFDDGLQHVWYPYCQMKTASMPSIVSHAEGVYIHLENGKKLIDAISSWWVMCHGHNHPYIKQAIIEQMEHFSHVIFAGLAHEPAFKLAKRLTSILPEGLKKVFYSDSGSVAVEVAMKMAVQFYYNQGINKNKILSFDNGYHGDTMGTMSISSSNMLTNYTPKQYIRSIPTTEHDLILLEEFIASKKDIAAVIIEPLVQCAGGMKFHSPQVLRNIYNIIKKYNIIFIADEVATGFGRTGQMFACQEAGITPDIICIGKAITGGFMPLAATVSTNEVFEAFYDNDPKKLFYHGPTYMANPLACSAANASLDLFEQEKYPDNAILNIENWLKEILGSFKTLPNVVDVRVKGAIGVIEFVPNFIDVAMLRASFIKAGVLIRPLENIIYIMPPFIIKKEHLQYIVDKIVEILYKNN